MTPTTEHDYLAAERRWLDRHGVDAQVLSIPAPSMSGRAHVLVTGSGPPVLLLIGGAVPAAMWAPLMARLPGYRLYAVDLPNHGLTSPASVTTSTLRPLMTRFLLDLLDGLDVDRPVVVAQSMGGLFATWLATSHPERVAAISYVACPAFVLGTSAPVPFRLMSVRPLGRLLGWLRPPSPRQVEGLSGVAGEDFAQHPELRDLMVALERRPGFGAGLVQLMHSCLTLRGARPEVALTADMLRAVRVPTQLVWGEGDTFGPPSVGRRVAGLVGDSEFHLVRGGHAPWLDDADAVAEHVLSFVSRHTTPAR
jgi:pimeloyl-ACP methyl ester carboxylesterase